MGVIRSTHDLGNGWQEVTADLDGFGSVTVTVPTVLRPGESVMHLVELAAAQANYEPVAPRVTGKERRRNAT